MSDTLHWRKIFLLSADLTMWKSSFWWIPLSVFVCENLLWILFLGRWVKKGGDYEEEDSKKSMPHTKKKKMKTFICAQQVHEDDMD